MTGSRIDGFRLGIYVFEDAEVVDFAAPYGVFSVARRHDPALDVFLVAETLRPVQTQAGFTVLPGYDFASGPAMNQATDQTPINDPASQVFRKLRNLQ